MCVRVIRRYFPKEFETPVNWLRILAKDPFPMQIDVGRQCDKTLNYFSLYTHISIYTLSHLNR